MAKDWHEWKALDRKMFRNQVFHTPKWSEVFLGVSFIFRQQFYLSLGESCTINCTIEIELQSAMFSDSGGYILESAEDACTHVEISIYVLANPICTSVHQKESLYLRMSCEWAPVNYGDTLLFRVGNKTLLENMYHGMIKEMKI